MSDTEYLEYCDVCRGSFTNDTQDVKECPFCVDADERRDDEF